MDEFTHELTDEVDLAALKAESEAFDASLSPAARRNLKRAYRPYKRMLERAERITATYFMGLSHRPQPALVIAPAYIAPSSNISIEARHVRGRDRHRGEDDSAMTAQKESAPPADPWGGATRSCLLRGCGVAPRFAPLQAWAGAL